MIKLSFCLRRLARLSLADFQSYWLHNHGPLVAHHAETLRIRRYVQLHTLAIDLNEGIRRGRSGPEAYDGIAQLWFDNLEDLAAANSSATARAAQRELLEDERKFIDLARSPLFFGEEKAIVG